MELKKREIKYTLTAFLPLPLIADAKAGEKIHMSMGCHGVKGEGT